jgi:hypothetical protein
VDRAIGQRIRTTGFSRVAVSLDGAVAETRDNFRRLPGSHTRMEAEPFCTHPRSTSKRNDVDDRRCPCAIRNTRFFTF